MRRFPGIDGLRAWLAWTIVASHIFLFTAINNRYPVLGKFDNAAHQAVLVFIIVSGFVITHLLLEKKEPWPVFIARRFLRLYPVYIICFAVGIFTTYLHLDAFLPHPFGPYMPEPDLLANEVAGLSQYGVSPYIITHLLMIHGAIPNQLLNQSQYMFLGIAWTLSLEWQFYLVAPLVVRLLQHTWGKLGVAAAATAGYYAYTAGYFGDFEALSFLPGAVLYFAVGIATRLLIYKMKRTSAYPLAGLIIGFAFIHMTQTLLPFLIWMAFLAWMLIEKPADALSADIKSVLDAAFQSRTARYLGKLSYATFLSHEPIMHAVGYVCVKQLHMGMYGTTAVAITVCPPLILLASAALHKYVEQPAIDFGKNLFQKPVPAQAALEKLAKLQDTEPPEAESEPALKVVGQQ